MIVVLNITALIIIACVVCNKISSKIGMPMLLFFILLGMLVGSDGLFKVPFADYALAEQICSIALIFIMFYGGFGTKWSAAKPVAAKAIVLSSFGTVITAGLVGLFCYYVLKIGLLESFLIGSVISSTDAASVFSILRSKHLNLRYNTASLLEVESGSNDPFSYMLTILILSLMNGNTSAGSFAYLLFSQIVYGVLFGFGIAALTLLLLKKLKISSSGFSAIFVVAIAIISYATPSLFGGNGYLSAYITGIVLGNFQIDNKPELIHFFDGATGLMQMLLFFSLGLLSFPSQLLGIAPIAFSIALFLTFIARPLTVFAILTPFKCNVRQQLLISWFGMRGAASIVFAIMVVINPASTNNDVFHIVFFIVLFSILLQGTLVPFISSKLDMADPEADVMKTFNDYIDETPLQFIQFMIPSSHQWVGKTIEEILLPPESLVVLLIRNKERLVPNGKMVLQTDDTLILSGKATYQTDQIKLYEKRIEKEDDWINKTIADISPGKKLIILIRRESDVIIPKGSTVLKKNDVLVVMDERNFG